MDKTLAAHRIIEATLPLVVFDGWNMCTLHQAAVHAGYKKTDVIRVFPGGAVDAVDWYLFTCDNRMIEAMKSYHLDTLKLRQRIALAVRLRIETHLEHKETARRTVAFLSLPLYAATAVRLLYRTVDCIWHAVGDNSTDFSFYTKRLSLAAIYSATLLHFLDDTSPAYESTWSFLERRIDDIMTIGKAKKTLKEWMENHRRRFA